MSRTAPPGSLLPEAGGPLWRDSLNMIAMDGVLRPRSAVTLPSGFELTAYGAMESSPVVTETPLLILTAHAPSATAAISAANPPCANVYSVPDDSPFCAVITSRQAFVYNVSAGTWVNVTPTYTTGTITATNGSATITGAGTAWLTQGLSPYQFILIDGAWYQICSIASNTSATLTTNFTGATGAGKAYTWRRTWDLTPGGLPSQYGLISGVAYNANLYFAGRFMARADGNLAPCVIRVQNIYAASPTTDYLTASTALEVGLDSISDLTDITGIAALQDGRVIITGNGSTVFWSSPTNQKVWTATPGGRTVVVYLEGSINALGRIGEVLTLHYDHGVVLGYPTNQTEPPLSYRLSAATAGCYAPHTLETIGGREIYVTRNGGVAVFDLASSREIGQEIREFLQVDVQPIELRAYTWAGTDEHRGHYHLFLCESSTLTRVFTLDLGTGAWWPGTLPALVTAAAEPNPFFARKDGHVLLGVASNNGGTERIGGILWMMTDDDAEDTLETSGAAATEYSCETDDLDFGAPLTYKTAVRFWAWLTPHTGAAASANVTIEASVTGGTSWETGHTKLVSTSAEYERDHQFSLLNQVPAAGQLRYRITFTRPSFALSRFIAEVNMGGDRSTVEL